MATSCAKRLECAVSRRFRFLNPRFARAYPRKKRRDTAHSKRFARFGGLARLGGVGICSREAGYLRSAVTGRLPKMEVVTFQTRLWGVIYHLSCQPKQKHFLTA